MWLLSLFCILICKFAASHFTSDPEPLPLPTAYGFSDDLFQPTPFHIFGAQPTEQFIYETFIPAQPLRNIPSAPEKLHHLEEKSESNKGENQKLSIDPMYLPTPKIKEPTENDKKAINSFPPLFNNLVTKKQPSSIEERITSYGLPYKEETRKVTKQDNIQKTTRHDSFTSRHSDKKSLSTTKQLFFNGKITPFSKFPTFSPIISDDDFFPSISLDTFDSFFPFPGFQSFSQRQKPTLIGSNSIPITSISPEPNQSTRDPGSQKPTSPPPLIAKETYINSNLPKQAQPIDNFPQSSLKW